MKRLLDIVLSLVALVLLSPLLLVVAAAIAARDGLPVLFVQQRVGRGGRAFGMFKFRSMVKNAAGIGPYYTASGDPRITPVGRFIRRTSIDELPQLLNVLLGDMSLVGPRPDLPVQRELYSEAQWRERCSVRPGITGLAQALLRSEGNQEQRLEMDLRYAREAGGLAGLWLDLRIMVWTLGRLSGKGSN
ncbi:MAG: sugar transferase [Comamonadaceae bacterium]|nr:MAG: sugar transferase [Comamonadaceae bacterium]